MITHDGTDIRSANAVTDFLKHETYYAQDGVLYNNPTPMPGQSEPVCIFYKDYDPIGILPEYSIVLPIHNQDSIIKRNLQTYIDHTTGVYEIIIILDNCIDNTEAEVIDFINDINQKVIDAHIIRIIVIRQDTPIYETSCDNIGFRLAEGAYAIQLQPDMQMVETGYNEAIRRPFDLWDDVIGVSGRGCHTFRPMHGPGKLAGKMEHPLEEEWDSQRDTFFVGETCMRGPLIFNLDKLRTMGYWDEKHFFLGKDERDLFARAWADHQWVCGYVPMEFKSPRQDGSTRKKKSPQDAEFRKIRQERFATGFWGEWMRDYPANKRPITTRDLVR